MITIEQNIININPFGGEEEMVKSATFSQLGLAGKTLKQN